jgi:NADH-quinone oxidoreductase subunit G
VAPFTETSGTFINTEGRVQSFNAVVKPLEDTRPAWKVLRVLGNVLGLAGFEQDSSEAVRNEILGSDAVAFVSQVNNEAPPAPVRLSAAGQALERVSDVPIHFADALVRRAPSLQQTRDAAPPAARMNAATLGGLGLGPGDKVRVRQGAGEALLEAALDTGVADGCVRVAAAHDSTAGLGGMFGELTVERA